MREKPREFLRSAVRKCERHSEREFAIGCTQILIYFSIRTYFYYFIYLFFGWNSQTPLLVEIFSNIPQFGKYLGITTFLKLKFVRLEYYM